MSNDEINVHNIKNDDDIDDDFDIADWKEPVKEPPSSSREEEGDFSL